MGKLAVFSAAGTVGTALTLRLLDQGHQVVVCTSHPEDWPLQHAHLSFIPENVEDSARLLEVLKECDAAYYLMHGQAGGEEGFEWYEANYATAFATAASKARLRKTVFLGALGEDEGGSDHLRSCHLVGKILGLGSVSCIEIRTSLIIGANVAAFEMIKAFQQRLPVRPYAAWLETPCQPIGLDDLITYMLGALDLQAVGHQVVEVGCPQVIPYGELLDLCARHDGHSHRPKFLVPSMEHRILQPFLDMVVPEFADLARRLLPILQHATVVSERKAEDLFPDITPLSLDEAMKKAVEESNTSYPAVWEGDFWKDVLDQTLLQSRQGQQQFFDKIKSFTVHAPKKWRDRLRRKKKK